MDCYVFFTKGRPPKRYKAENQIKACEMFYADHPEFHLRELLDIKIADHKNKPHWLDNSHLHRGKKNAS